MLQKWEAFGWLTYEVNGHDLEDVISKLILCHQLRATGKPQIIIAHTIKGKGVSFVETDFTYHGRALKAEQAELAREEINAAGK